MNETDTQDEKSEAMSKSQKIRPVEKNELTEEKKVKDSTEVSSNYYSAFLV
jgi:hypothetical protein